MESSIFDLIRSKPIKIKGVKKEPWRLAKKQTWQNFILTKDKRFEIFNEHRKKPQNR